MANPFDRFDSQQASGGNPFDQFDGAQPAVPKALGPVEELTLAERIAAKFPNWMAGSGGGVRGSAVGRLAMGAADPGVALVQLAANAVGAGDAVNQGIRDTEAKYQAARGEAGSTGFDPMRLVGSTAITLPAGLAGGAATTLGKTVLKGAAQGAVSGALNPVVDGDFFDEKAKQVALGAGGGAALAPVAGILSRLISPKASVDAEMAALRAAGVKPTIGQTLGGAANAAEEKLQSLPIMGDAIRAARNRASDQFREAALDRAAAPVGASVKGLDGGDAVGELSKRIGQAYDEVLPKMGVNVLDEGFLAKIGSLRDMAKTLPAEEARQFDAIIAREIDGRLAPNGVLSGQNLKSAWMSLRDMGRKFSRSPDVYQQQLGQAVKQTFQELKDHVSASNTPENVLALKNADFAWANFKRIQRAAGSLGAEDGKFSPAQLQSAVKALDRSKDKARFAEGDALMQDLSAVGKNRLSNKVPDSGTPTRLAYGAGALASGAINLGIPAALIAGAGAYTPPAQNFLVALLANRPEAAPAVANSLRRYLTGPLSVAGGDYFSSGGVSR